MSPRIVFTLLYLGSVHLLFFLAEHYYHEQCVGQGYTGFITSLASHFEPKCKFFRWLSHHASSRVVLSVTSILPFATSLFQAKAAAFTEQVPAEPELPTRKRRQVIYPYNKHEFSRELKRRTVAPQGSP